MNGGGPGGPITTGGPMPNGMPRAWFSISASINRRVMGSIVLDLLGLVFLSDILVYTDVLVKRRRETEEAQIA